ncbi:FecCD family ABC transporter permease [Streptomyces sp. R17]|uniref:FecCD family ABC transporter permease n=1 Tax=Streptomyces sp. R17 TaxID=3238626 RepID=A0AB39P116_9ACTN
MRRRKADESGAGRTKLAVTLLVLTALLLVSAMAGLAIGSVQVPPGQVWGIVTHALGAGWQHPDWSRARETIVVDVRAPRVLLGAVTGAGLAVIGTALQALLRNPLAEPYLLGVSSGASLGAVSVIVFGVTLFGPVSLSVAAFMGALGALLLVYATARTGGRITSSRLVLSGVAIAAVLTALLDLLLLTTDRGNEARAVLAWTLGGLGGVNWGTLWLPSTALLLGVGVLLAQARNLNLLLAGEEAATRDPHPTTPGRGLRSRGGSRHPSTHRRPAGDLPPRGVTFVSHSGGASPSVAFPARRPVTLSENLVAAARTVRGELSGS